MTCDFRPRSMNGVTLRFDPDKSRSWITVGYSPSQFPFRD